MLVPLPATTAAPATAAPRASTPESLIRELRSAVETRLGELLPDARGERGGVAAAMRYGVLAPGKRVRPMMVLLAARGLGADPRDLLDVACALEMVHAASLFLDDLPCMDDAQLRRNQPTVHVAYGEDVAMLAAVALLACAWRTAAKANGLPPRVRTEMVAVLSDAVGTDGLVAGQYRDLHEAGPQRTAGHAAQTNQQKTGALFTAAFELAALAAGSPRRTRELLREAADALGQAFQLADDLADGELDPAVIGKDCHQDAGKSTLVALVGPSGTRRLLDVQLRRAWGLLDEALPSDTVLGAFMQGVFRSAGSAPRAGKQAAGH